MKVTKLAQSTAIVVCGEHRVLIDPGIYNYDEGRMKRSDHRGITLLIITHEHPDHFDLATVKQIVEKDKVPVLTTEEVSGQLSKENIPTDVFRAGETRKFGALRVRAIEIDHVVQDKRIDGFGVLLEYQKKSFYHTSDTMYLKKKPYADLLFVPINNRGICMNIDEAVRFTQEVNPKIVVPIHYDSPKDKDKVNPREFKDRMNFINPAVRVQILGFGQSVEI